MKNRLTNILELSISHNVSNPIWVFMSARLTNDIFNSMVSSDVYNCVYVSTGYNIHDELQEHVREMNK